MVSSMDHAMLAMVRLLGRSLNRDAVAQAIAQAATQLPTADAAAMLRLDAETDTMVVEAGWGLAPSQQPLPVSQALAGRALSEGTRVTADNLAVASDLRPTALDELGLTAALHGLANDFTERTGVRIEPHLASPYARLPGPTEIVLYRVAQEALSNVGKHAQATTVRLELAVTGTTVRVEVADNGIGFLPGQRRGSPETGLGLLGMEERVQALLGRLTIDSAVGSGTRVQVELPVVAPATAQAAGRRLMPQTEEGRRVPAEQS